MVKLDAWKLEINYNKTWIVVNTIHANDLAYQRVLNDAISELSNYQVYKLELPYASKSRIDILDFFRT